MHCMGKEIMSGAILRAPYVEDDAIEVAGNYIGYGA